MAKKRATTAAAAVAAVAAAEAAVAEAAVAAAAAPVHVPVGLVCFWEYRPAADRGGPFDCPWALVEWFTYDSNDDVDPQPRTPLAHRHWTDSWIYEAEAAAGQDEDDDDEEMVPRPGRLVTRWCVSSGVSLAAFSAPAGCPWLGIGFERRLLKSRHWWEILQGGLTLHERTLQLAGERVLKVTA